MADIDARFKINNVQQELINLEADVFAAAEMSLNIKIPKTLKNLLIVTGFENETTISEISNSDIEDIVWFAQYELHKIINKEDLPKYYGLFWKKPSLFTIVPGYRRIIFLLSDYYKKKLLYKNTMEKKYRVKEELTKKTEKRCWTTLIHEEVTDDNLSTSEKSSIMDEEITSSEENTRKRKASVSRIQDKARSDATFRYTVKNVKKIRHSQLSPEFYVRNLPWTIMLRLSQTQEKQPQKSLSFFLRCNEYDKSTSWRCYAVAELRLLSCKERGEPFSRKIQRLYCSKSKSWGFRHFMAWHDVVDPDKGFIKNNSITLEVYVKADAPYNV